MGVVEDVIAADPGRRALADAAAEAGLEPALARWILLSAGVSATSLDELSDDDVQRLRRIAGIVDAGLPLVALLQLVRVYGQALAQIADGYTRLTEQEGEQGGRRRGRALHRAGRRDAPEDARVIKTIGDEVMVVGSDGAALADWAVGFQDLMAAARPPPRIGVHCGPALYRDGDHYGRAVNQASRVVARAAGGEVVVPRPGVARRGLAPRVRAAGRGPPQGLQRRHRAVPGPPVR